MKPCRNCNKPLKNGNRRCGACADHWLRHGTERPAKWTPPDPLPTRVELYRRGRAVASVRADDPDGDSVCMARREIAAQRHVPIAAIVPVLRPARG